MTKADFLAGLRNELKDVSTEEREEALKFYSEYFDDAGEENEQNVISELGSPERVAATIRANCVSVPAVIPDSKANAKRSDSPPNSSRVILIVILVLLTFPLWVGIVAAGFGILISFIAIVFALLITGGALIFSGVAVFFVSLGFMATGWASAVLTAGIGLVLAAVGLILCGLMVFLIGKGLPFIGRSIGRLFQSLFGRRNKQ